MSGWKARDSIYLAVPGVTPHAEWALRQNAGRRYLLRGDRGEWLPVLIELDGISVENLKQGVTDDGKPFISDDEGDDTLAGYWRKALEIPDFQTKLEGQLKGATLGFATAYVRQPKSLGEWRRDDSNADSVGFFDLLAANTNPLLQQVIRRITIGLTPPAPARARALGGPRSATKNKLEIEDQLEGQAVVMGVIDDAIAVANDRFSLAPGAPGEDAMTRVKFAWVQDGEHLDLRDGVVQYGAEITAPMINKARANHADESDRYRALGLVRFDGANDTLETHKGLAHRTAHGTHVLDVMAGVAPQERDGTRPIVSVQLPASTTANTSGPDLDLALLDGVMYILFRTIFGFASPDPHPLPVVINCSYGYLAGPCDGTRPVEVALDLLLGVCQSIGWPVALVLPAGNSHLARCHAVIPTGKGTSTLGLVVQPDDHTPSFVEVWLPCGTNDDGEAPLTLVVTPPSGPARKVPVVVGRLDEWLDDNDQVICQVSCVRVPAPTSRMSLMLTIAPTASLDVPTVEEPPAASEPDAALAPCGTWQLEFVDDGLPGGHYVHAWVKRDESLHGHPRRGRQARFTDSIYVRFDGPDGQGEQRVADDSSSFIQRGGSQNAIATGRHPLVVGASRAARGGAGPDASVLAPYSAGGPLPVPCDGVARTGPDLSATADHSAVHRGVLGAGSANGSRVLMDGTSVAAPLAARQLADEMVRLRASGTPPEQLVDAAKAALVGVSNATTEAPARAGEWVMLTGAAEQAAKRRIGETPG